MKGGVFAQQWDENTGMETTEWKHFTHTSLINWNNVLLLAIICKWKSSNLQNTVYSYLTIIFWTRCYSYVRGQTDVHMFCKVRIKILLYILVTPHTSIPLLFNINFCTTSTHHIIVFGVEGFWCVCSVVVQ